MNECYCIPDDLSFSYIVRARNLSLGILGFPRPVPSTDIINPSAGMDGASIASKYYFASIPIDHDASSYDPFTDSRSNEP